MPSASDRARRREILSLAVPAFFALIAEPLFLLADSAIVGHLGTAQLAALGVAGSVLATAVGLFVFLAYATTATVARAVGAGASERAVSAGVDGCWLALALGVPVGLFTWIARVPLAAGLGATGEVLGHAAAYLGVSALGLPAMLFVLAATGALRGFQDTRTPLVASVAGFTLNLLANLLFVYGFGWGIAGSAAGTVLAQAAMAIGLGLAFWRRARGTAVRLRPHPGRVWRAAADGAPLVVRTMALRAVLLITTWVAAGLGEVPLAAHQVAFTVWTFLAFALDALAIAAQALTGRALGAADVAGTREATALMVRWGVTGGVVVGLAVAALAPVLPWLFTTDPAVRSAITGALVVVGLTQGLSGYVFVLDGVLIGAGDGRWLAGGMTVVTLLYVPVALLVRGSAGWLLGHGTTWATVALWIGFGAFMVVRSVMLGVRERSSGWLVTGLER